MWVRISSQTAPGCHLCCNSAQLRPYQFPGWQQMAFVPCHSGGVRSPSRAGWDVWLLLGSILAVLSPWPGGPGSVPAVPGARWHRTPGDSTRMLLLLSSGILWKVQALPFLRAPGGAAAPGSAQGREGADELWAPGPSDGAEPWGCVGPFSLLQLPNGWKQEQNQAEKWEFALLFCPDAASDCRVTPGEILSEIWVSLLHLAYL